MANIDLLAADLDSVKGKVRPPVGVILGAPSEVADLAGWLNHPEVVCYQMDLYPAERLKEELDRRGLAARVVPAADLWDLPADFQTVLYPAPQGGERALKLDMIEQAFHVLRSRGVLIVWSPYEKELLFPTALKKVFRRVHAPATSHFSVFWCQREGDRPRRRHEVTYQVRLEAAETSLRFLSRPGVFSHGRFDHGARALTETMVIHPGDRIVDVGCGCGTNGIIAGRLSGPTGSVTFLDSNLRALALAEHNAAANGLKGFQTVATTRVEGAPEGSFDVALANPPYFAQLAVGRLFIERSWALLRPGGRLYLVSKQPNQLGPFAAEIFGRTEAVQRRGYTILSSEKGKAK
ncbi:MAG: methyltransferase [Planctomycetes bacterium]|nr:methyltransferase [Planctomycetota bacterium]